eukprot:2013183-Pyramimonas_sp.AAC.1
MRFDLLKYSELFMNEPTVASKGQERRSKRPAWTYGLGAVPAGDDVPEWQVREALEATAAALPLPPPPSAPKAKARARTRTRAPTRARGQAKTTVDNTPYDQSQWSWQSDHDWNHQQQWRDDS